MPKYSKDDFDVPVKDYDFTKVNDVSSLIDQMKDAPHWFTFYVNDIADKSGHVNVLDVLLEANVSNAYLDMGTEVLNGTKSPQEAMDFIRKVALEAKAAM